MVRRLGRPGVEADRVAHRRRWKAEAVMIVVKRRRGEALTARAPAPVMGEPATGGREARPGRDLPPFAYSSGSVVKVRGWPSLRAMSVARVAFSSATSLVNTATTQDPSRCAVSITP